MYVYVCMVRAAWQQELGKWLVTLYLQSTCTQRRMLALSHYSGLSPWNSATSFQGTKVTSPPIKLTRLATIGSKKYCVLNTTNRESRSCQYDLMEAKLCGFFQSDSLHWLTEPCKSDLPRASQARVLQGPVLTCFQAAGNEPHKYLCSFYWRSSFSDIEPIERKLQNVLERKKKSNFNFRSGKLYSQSRWSVFLDHCIL